jgi:hypothetical protein
MTLVALGGRGSLQKPRPSHRFPDVPFYLWLDREQLTLSQLVPSNIHAMFVKGLFHSSPCLGLSGQHFQAKNQGHDEKE